MKNRFDHGRAPVRALLAAACVASLAACTSLSRDEAPPGPGTAPEQDARSAVGFAQFQDIAVPGGAKMDVERSLVLGARDTWIGRLSMTTPGTTTETYDFFLREMPRFGWQEITTVRSEVSVLTYARGERVATVQIGARTLGGSHVDVTVSPRGRPNMPAMPDNTVTPAPPR